MVVVVTMVTAAFSTGCLSAQAGSRFSISPISNFQDNPKRKVLPHFTDVDIQVQKWEVACPETEPKWDCVLFQWLSLSGWLSQCPLTLGSRNLGVLPWSLEVKGAGWGVRLHGMGSDCHC